MTKRKPSPWRNLANEGPIGQEYPAMVENYQEEIPVPSQAELIAYMNREVPAAPEGAYESLPQEVKGNSWAALQANSPDPSIFGQVRNTIRRRMWR